jgi:type I restriction enzyme S subunit
MSNNKDTLVPKLRFPEFQNAGEWVVKKLGEVAEVYQPETISQMQLKKDGYLVYGANGIIGRFDKYNHEKSQIAVACRGSSCGTVNFTEPKSWITGNAMVVNVDDFDDVHKKFMYYQLFNANLDYLITGSGQPQITSNIKNHRVILASLPEQEKIASCLSSLDEVITGEQQKLELLKQHKKGLLQNLFPQEGETVPKLRFNEFENSGEWVEHELGSFCKSLSSGKDKNEIDGEYELYGSTGIIGKTKKASYDGEFILVARVGANAGLLNKVRGKFGVTDNTLVIDLIYKEIISFIYYSLECFGLNKLVFGSSQPLITGGQLKEFLLLIPPSEKEQQKIAACLSSLDEIITAQTQKIEQLQRHKKGLLQGLFPNMNEYHE